jgi:hypothetical protein
MSTRSLVVHGLFPGVDPGARGGSNRPFGRHSIRNASVFERYLVLIGVPVLLLVQPGSTWSKVVFRNVSIDPGIECGVDF